MQDVVKPAKLAHQAAKAQATQKSAARKPRSMDVIPTDTKHRQVQPAKTLARSGVVRPKLGLKRRTNALTPTSILIKKPQFDVSQKLSVNQVDQRREKHAGQIHQSKLIKRFAKTPTAWYDMPSHAGANVKVYKQTEADQKQQKSMDIFQRAIDNAESHKLKPVNPRKLAKQAKRVGSTHRARRARLANYGLLGLIIVLTACVATYANRSNIILHFANAKAGFRANLPDYNPDGFTPGKFNYSPGTVSVNYDRSSTGRHYTFSETVSTLNADTLRSSNIISTNDAYQTLQNGGRTIYIYGDNNAAWTESGMLYQITSNGSLSTSDVLAIAKST